jgi:hypothetical protein
MAKGGVLGALLLAFVAVFLAEVAAAAPRRLPAGQPPAFARSCTIRPPDIAPLFPAPAEAATASAPSDDDPDEDDGDDDEDDDDEDDEDDVPGVILPGSATCLAITGSVTAGLQYDSYRIPRAGAAQPSPAFSWPTTSSLRFETALDLPSGLRVGSAFEMSLRPGGGEPDAMLMEEAIVTVGTMTFGLSSSRFSFWTGEEFAFSARLPGRNVGLIAWERDLTERWNLALALEDPTLATTSTIPVVNGRVPDGVARLTYTAGGLTLHMGGALRDVAGSPHRLGRAGILGVTYELPILGRPGEVTAQIASATDAAAYIGSSLDATVVRQVITPSDSSRGFSGVLAARREWTDDLASNIFVSRYQLSVPFTNAGRGKLRIDRASANLVWTPVEGFKAGLEGSVAWTSLAFPSRTLAASLGGRQLSAQLFIERSF